MRWFPVLLLLSAPGLAWGWPPNGVRLTGAVDDQGAPVITSDGAGGAFVAWQDLRDYFNGGPIGRTDCYVQRVTNAGQLAAGWQPDGFPVAAGPGHQTPAALIPDGSGGVLIVFGSTRFDFGDLHLQRITAAGTIVPGWPTTGVPIGIGPRQQFAPKVAGDGAGGVFVSWQDSNGSSDSRARYTHVLGDGTLAPGWPSNGRLFEPGPFQVSRPLLLPIGAGGFLACWAVDDDSTQATTRVHAQRFTSDGEADPAWPVGGVVVCPALPSSRGPVESLVPDGTGGFYTLMEDYRNSPGSFAEIDLYAQHVLGSGAIAPGWPALGLSLSDAFAFQLSPELAWDGWRGAYLTWNNLETGGYHSYVQHLTASGVAAPGWPTGGLPVIPIATDQYVPTIVSDGRGGAIVAWEDRRDGANDVYAQRFADDVVVAARVSLASAEATPTEVRLRWQVSGETRASVERREGEAAWEMRAQVEADGGGYMSHVDRDVTPGGRYGYRLVFASGARGGETSIDVPAALALALEGARPNPASGTLWLAFTLADAAPARLALFDLAGRQVTAREVGSRGAGQHIVRLDDVALSPGLYWAALTQGSRTLRTRVAVVR